MTVLPDTRRLAPASRPAPRLLAVAALALAAGCGGVQVRPSDQVPPPLVDELPLRAGAYYSPEFRNFVHQEQRWGTTWTVELGGAHVTKLDRLLRAMFPNLVPVADVGKPPQPPLDLILEPRFEEYSFLTPRDSGADYYAVTIKYRANLYDGAGRVIDSLVYTGYGNAKSSGLTTEGPLVIATEKAMRDAGAKFATEFPAQETVQKLLRGETVEAVQPGAAAAGTIEEVEPLPGDVAAPAGTPTSSAPPPGAPPPGAPPPGEPAAVEATAAPAGVAPGAERARDVGDASPGDASPGDAAADPPPGGDVPPGAEPDPTAPPGGEQPPPSL